jgi:hypothetical protein
MFRGIGVESMPSGSSTFVGKGAFPPGVRVPDVAEEEVIFASKERRDMKKIVFLIALAVSFVGTGCMSGYYTHRDRDLQAVQDSLLPPPMTIDDVIALAKDSVGDDVIINQIKATDSYFKLTTDDILTLKKEGVSERVISAMIQTSQKPRPVRRTRVYAPLYDPYWSAFWHPYSWDYWYPWYPSVYLGYSHMGRYYGGHLSVGHYGGHASVGHRSGGGRR